MISALSIKNTLNTNQILFNLKNKINKCPLCSSKLISENYKILNISQCNNCKFIFRNKEKTTNSDLIEGAYYSSKKIGSIVNKRFVKHFSKRANQHFNFIKKFFTDQPKKGLDIGCGAGFFMKKLIEHNWSAVGIEPDPTMSAYAKKNGLNVEQKLLEDFHYADRFGLIYLSHVLDDIPYINNSLEKISNLICENGLLFVEVPNYSWSYRLNFTKEEDIRIGQYFFSYDTLHKVMKKHGFEMIKQYSFESVHTNSIYQKISSPLRVLIKLKPSKMKSYLRGIYRKI
tara:strand:- start:6957 stop:7814 length:858 start_codon:yes stop_codon:yes gene_type:complete